MSELKCPNIKIYKCSDGFVTDNAQVAKSHEANIKSNKLICPFCNQKLEYLAEDIYGNMYCPNCRDKNGFIYKASESIWQELIDSMKEFDLCHDALVERTKELDRTHKALDAAVDALDYLRNTNPIAFQMECIENALNQITAEQKDK